AASPDPVDAGEADSSARAGRERFRGYLSVHDLRYDVSATRVAEVQFVPGATFAGVKEGGLRHHQYAVVGRTQLRKVHGSRRRQAGSRQQAALGEFDARRAFARNRESDDVDVRTYRGRRAVDEDNLDAAVAVLDLEG